MTRETGRARNTSKTRKEGRATVAVETNFPVCVSLVRVDPYILFICWILRHRPYRLVNICFYILAIKQKETSFASACCEVVGDLQRSASRTRGHGYDDFVHTQTAHGFGLRSGPMESYPSGRAQALHAPTDAAVADAAQLANGAQMQTTAWGFGANQLDADVC